MAATMNNNNAKIAQINSKEANQSLAEIRKGVSDTTEEIVSLLDYVKKLGESFQKLKKNDKFTAGAELDKYLASVNKLANDIASKQANSTGKTGNVFEGFLTNIIQSLGTNYRFGTNKSENQNMMKMVLKNITGSLNGKTVSNDLIANIAKMFSGELPKSLPTTVESIKPIKTSVKTASKNATKQVAKNISKEASNFINMYKNMKLETPEMVSLNDFIKDLGNEFDQLKKDEKFTAGAELDKYLASVVKLFHDFSENKPKAIKQINEQVSKVVEKSIGKGADAVKFLTADDYNDVKGYGKKVEKILDYDTMEKKTILQGPKAIGKLDKKAPLFDKFLNTIVQMLITNHQFSNESPENNYKMTKMVLEKISGKLKGKILTYDTMSNMKIFEETVKDFLDESDYFEEFKKTKNQIQIHEILNGLLPTSKSKNKTNAKTAEDEMDMSLFGFKTSQKFKDLDKSLSMSEKYDAKELKGKSEVYDKSGGYFDVGPTLLRSITVRGNLKNFIEKKLPSKYGNYEDLEEGSQAQKEYNILRSEAENKIEFLKQLENSLRLKYEEVEKFLIDLKKSNAELEASEKSTIEELEQLKSIQGMSDELSPEENAILSQKLAESEESLAKLKEKSGSDKEKRQKEFEYLTKWVKTSKELVEKYKAKSKEANEVQKNTEVTNQVTEQVKQDTEAKSEEVKQKTPKKPTKISAKGEENVAKTENAEAKKEETEAVKENTEATKKKTEEVRKDTEAKKEEAKQEQQTEKPKSKKQIKAEAIAENKKAREEAKAKNQQALKEKIDSFNQSTAPGTNKIVKSVLSAILNSDTINENEAKELEKVFDDNQSSESYIDDVLGNDIGDFKWKTEQDDNASIEPISQTIEEAMEQLKSFAKQASESKNANELSKLRKKVKDTTIILSNVNADLNEEQKSILQEAISSTKITGKNIFNGSKGESKELLKNYLEKNEIVIGEKAKEEQKEAVKENEKAKEEQKEAVKENTEATEKKTEAIKEETEKQKNIQPLENFLNTIEDEYKNKNNKWVSADNYKVEFNKNDKELLNTIGNVSLESKMAIAQKNEDLIDSIGNETKNLALIVPEMKENVTKDVNSFVVDTENAVKDTMNIVSKLSDVPSLDLNTDRMNNMVDKLNLDLGKMNMVEMPISEKELNEVKTTLEEAKIEEIKSFEDRINELKENSKSFEKSVKELFDDKNLFKKEKFKNYDSAKTFKDKIDELFGIGNGENNPAMKSFKDSVDKAFKNIVPNSIKSIDSFKETIKNQLLNTLKTDIQNYDSNSMIENDVEKQSTLIKSMRELFNDSSYFRKGNLKNKKSAEAYYDNLMDLLNGTTGLVGNDKINNIKNILTEMVTKMNLDDSKSRQDFKDIVKVLINALANYVDELKNKANPRDILNTTDGTKDTAEKISKALKDKPEDITLESERTNKSLIKGLSKELKNQEINSLFGYLNLKNQFQTLPKNNYERYQRIKQGLETDIPSIIQEKRNELANLSNKLHYRGDVFEWVAKDRSRYEVVNEELEKEINKTKPISVEQLNVSNFDLMDDVLTKKETTQPLFPRTIEEYAASATVNDYDYYKNLIRDLSGEVSTKIGNYDYNNLPITNISDFGKNFENQIALLKQTDFSNDYDSYWSKTEISDIQTSLKNLLDLLNLYEELPNINNINDRIKSAKDELKTKLFDIYQDKAPQTDLQSILLNYYDVLSDPNYYDQNKLSNLELYANDQDRLFRRNEIIINPFDIQTDKDVQSKINNINLDEVKNKAQDDLNAKRIDANAILTQELQDRINRLSIDKKYANKVLHNDNFEDKFVTKQLDLIEKLHYYVENYDNLQNADAIKLSKTTDLNKSMRDIFAKGFGDEIKKLSDTNFVKILENDLQARQDYIDAVMRLIDKIEKYDTILTGSYATAANKAANTTARFNQILNNKGISTVPPTQPPVPPTQPPVPPTQPPVPPTPTPTPTQQNMPLRDLLEQNLSVSHFAEYAGLITKPESGHITNTQNFLQAGLLDTQEILGSQFTRLINANNNPAEQQTMMNEVKNYLLGLNTKNEADRKSFEEDFKAVSEAKDYARKMGAIRKFMAYGADETYKRSVEDITSAKTRYGTNEQIKTLISSVMNSAAHITLDELNNSKYAKQANLVFKNLTDYNNLNEAQLKYLNKGKRALDDDFMYPMAFKDVSAINAKITNVVEDSYKSLKQMYEIAQNIRADKLGEKWNIQGENKYQAIYGETGIYNRLKAIRDSNGKYSYHGKEYDLSGVLDSNMRAEITKTINVMEELKKRYEDVNDTSVNASNIDAYFRRLMAGNALNDFFDSKKSINDPNSIGIKGIDYIFDAVKQNIFGQNVLDRNISKGYKELSKYEERGRKLSGNLTWTEKLKEYGKNERTKNLQVQKGDVIGEGLEYFMNYSIDNAKTALKNKDLTNYKKYIENVKTATDGLSDYLAEKRVEELEANNTLWNKIREYFQKIPWSKVFGKLHKGLKDTFNGMWQTFRGLGGMVESTYRKVRNMALMITGAITGAVATVTGAVTLGAYKYKKYAEQVITTTEKYRQYQIALKGSLKTQEDVNKLMSVGLKVTSDMPIAYDELMESLKSITLISPIANMMTDAEATEKTLKKVYTILTGLHQLQPQWGMSGAVFSLRNALAGDLRSLERRFDLPTRQIQSTKGMGLSNVKHNPKELIESLYGYFQGFMDEGTLKDMNKQFSKSLIIMKATWENFLFGIGDKGFYDTVANDFVRLREKFQDFVNSSFGQNLQQRLSNIFVTIYNDAKKLGNYVIKLIGGKDIFTTVTNGLEYVAKTFRYVTKMILAFDWKKVIPPDFVKDIAEKLTGKTLKEKANATLEDVAELFKDFNPLKLIKTEGFQKAFDNIKNNVKTALDIITKTVETIWDELKTVYNWMETRFGRENTIKGLLVTYLLGPTNIITTLSGVTTALAGILTSATAIATMFGKIAIGALGLKGTLIAIGALPALDLLVHPVKYFNAILSSAISILQEIYEFIYKNLAFPIFEKIADQFPSFGEKLMKESIKDQNYSYDYNSSFIENIANYFTANNNEIIDKNRQTNIIDSLIDILAHKAYLTDNDSYNYVEFIKTYKDNNASTHEKEIQKYTVEELKDYIDDLKNDTMNNKDYLVKPFIDQKMLDTNTFKNKYLNHRFNSIDDNMEKIYKSNLSREELIDLIYRKDVGIFAKGANKDNTLNDYHGYAEDEFKNGTWFGGFGDIISKGFSAIKTTYKEVDDFFENNKKQAEENEKNAKKYEENVKKTTEANKKVAEANEKLADSTDTVAEHLNEINSQNLDIAQKQLSETDWISLLKKQYRESYATSSNIDKQMETYLPEMMMFNKLGEGLGLDALEEYKASVVSSRQQMRETIKNYKEYQEKRATLTQKDDFEYFTKQIEELEKIQQNKVQNIINQSTYQALKQATEKRKGYMGSFYETYLESVQKVNEESIKKEATTNATSEVMMEYAELFQTDPKVNEAFKEMKQAMLTFGIDMEEFFNDVDGYLFKYKENEFFNNFYQGTEFTNLAFMGSGIQLDGLISGTIYKMRRSGEFSKQIKENLPLDEKIKEIFNELKIQYSENKRVLKEQNKFFNRDKKITEISAMPFSDINRKWEENINNSSKKVRQAAITRYNSLAEDEYETDINNLWEKTRDAAVASFETIFDVIQKGTKETVDSVRNSLENGLTNYFMGDGKGSFRGVWKEIGNALKKNLFGSLSSQIANNVTEAFFGLSGKSNGIQRHFSSLVTKGKLGNLFRFGTYGNHGMSLISEKGMEQVNNGISNGLNFMGDLSGLPISDLDISVPIGKSNFIGDLLGGKSLLQAFTNYSDNVLGTTGIMKGASSLGKSVGSIIRMIGGKKAAGFAANSANFLSKAGGLATLGVVGVLSQKGWLGGAKDRTAEGRARYDEYNAYRNSLVKKRYDTASQYYMSDLSDLILDYQFGGINAWTQKRGKWYKGTKRKVMNTDATDFVESMKDYWDLMLEAAKDQLNKQRALNKLQSINQEEYIKKSYEYAGKQLDMQRNELSDWKGLLDNFKGKNATYTYTDSEGFSYTFQDVNDEIEKLTNSIAESEDKFNDLAEQMDEYRKAFAGVYDDYILKAMYGDSDVARNQMSIDQIHREYDRFMSEGGEAGSKEWIEYQIRLIDAQRDLTNAIKQLHSDYTNQMHDVVSSTHVKNLKAENLKTASNYASAIENIKGMTFNKNAYKTINTASGSYFTRSGINNANTAYRNQLQNILNQAGLKNISVDDYLQATETGIQLFKQSSPISVVGGKDQSLQNALTSKGYGELIGQKQLRRMNEGVKIYADSFNSSNIKTVNTASLTGNVRYLTSSQYNALKNNYVEKQVNEALSGIDYQYGYASVRGSQNSVITNWLLNNATDVRGRKLTRNGLGGLSTDNIKFNYDSLKSYLQSYYGNQFSISSSALSKNYINALGQGTNNATTRVGYSTTQNQKVNSTTLGALLESYGYKGELTDAQYNEALTRVLGNLKGGAYTSTSTDFNKYARETMQIWDNVIVAEKDGLGQLVGLTAEKLEELIEEIQYAISRQNDEYDYAITELKTNLNNQLEASFGSLKSNRTTSVLEPLTDYVKGLAALFTYINEDTNLTTKEDKQEFLYKDAKGYLEQIGNYLENYSSGIRNMFDTGLFSMANLEDALFLSDGKNLIESFYEQTKTIKNEILTSAEKGKKANISNAIEDLQDNFVKSIESWYYYAADIMNKDTMRNAVLSSISGFDDFKIANSAREMFNNAISGLSYGKQNTIETLMGIGNGEFGTDSLSAMLGISSADLQRQDPYELYYEYEKSKILNRIENAEEESDEAMQAYADLWNVMKENAEYLKRKADETTESIEKMLDRIEETSRTRVSEEAKTQKGDIIFIDLGSARDMNGTIRSMIDRIKTNDPDAQKLVNELKTKLLNLRK